VSSLSRLTEDQFYALLPETSKAVIALSATAKHIGLDPVLTELVNLRCSQLNGCAWCIAYHTQHLLKSGLSAERIGLVSAWEEAGIFSEREAAALAWAEELTLVAERHVSDAAYAAATAVFSDADLAALTVTIATINVWNRFNVAYRFPPEITG